MTASHDPKAPRPTRPLRNQKPPPVPTPAQRRSPADSPPPSASSTIPISPEDILGELEN